MGKPVLVIGTLDTKEKEIIYLRKRIEAQGLRVLFMDVSCRTQKLGTPVEIPGETVAREEGKTFGEISQLDKISAVRAISAAAAKKVLKMVAQEEFYGVIAMGGGNGTEIATYVMRQLPVGFPKIMVSCVASGNVRPYVGTKDIMMIYSIGDISLNRITKRIINNAVLALRGMVSETGETEEEEKPQICISTFAVTLPCVERARNLLHEKGFEVIELHASGSGGMALEELVRSGEISGVLDITASEVVNELLGGIYSAGPHRLEAAGATRVPQVISLGAYDFANFGSKETIPEKYKGRNFFFYTPSITLMRTNVEENHLFGKVIANKLNNSCGPTALLVPRNGFSALDRGGSGRHKMSLDGTIRGEWYDPEADLALIASLKRHLDLSRVLLQEVDFHINDPQFAEMAVELLCRLMQTRYKGEKGS
jgi:uncharacterized protein (UPF0261 family)